MGLPDIWLHFYALPQKTLSDCIRNHDLRIRVNYQIRTILRKFHRICLSPRCFAIHSLQCPKKQMHIFVACQWWDAACLMSNSKSLARTEQSASAIWMIFSPYKLWPQEFFSQTIMHCAVGLQVIYVPLKHHEFVILRSSVLMLVF